MVNTSRTINFELCEDRTRLICKAGDFDWLKRLRFWSRVQVAFRLVFERKKYSDEALNE